MIGSMMAGNLGTKSDTSSAVSAETSAEFALVFAEHQSAIYGYVYRMIGNADDAADLTLTAFEKALRAWSRRPVDLQVRPWLYRIATNACLDELRHRKLIRWLRLDFAEGDDAPLPEPVASDDPASDLLRAEDARCVRAALARLPERYRTALLLREAEGLSCEEIGDTLGISRSAAKVLLFRAREKLKLTYNQLFGEAPQ